MSENKLKRKRMTPLSVVAPMTQNEAISILCGHSNKMQEFAKPCCPKCSIRNGCFLSNFTRSTDFGITEVDFIEASIFFMSVREKMRIKTESERNDTLVGLFRDSIVSDGSSSRLHHSWSATVGDKTIQLCREEWAFLFNFSQNSLKRLSQAWRAPREDTDPISLESSRDYGESTTSPTTRRQKFLRTICVNLIQIW